MKREIIMHIQRNEFFEARWQLNELLLMPFKEVNPQMTISRAILFIRTNYMKNINLDDVGEYVNVSQEYLCRLFKDYMHMSFRKYLNFVRINVAEELLLKSPITVAKIAGKVGFSDVGYFIKKFKKCNGCTPGQFRAKLSFRYRKLERDYK